MKAEIDVIDSTKIAITEVPFAYNDLMKTVPSASFRPRQNMWFVSKTWQAILALGAIFNGKIDIQPKLRKWIDDEYENIILPAYQMRDEVLPDVAQNVLPNDSLYPHQKGDVAFLSLVRKGLLLNGLGSGKTTSAIATLKHLQEQGEEVFPALVVCPNSTKFGWKKEFARVWPEVTVSVIDGTATQRRKQFKEDAQVYVLNWDSVRIHSRLAPYGSIALKKCVACGGLDPKVKDAACHVHKKELNDIDFKSVIGDEIHRIIDPKSQTARAFKAATGDAENLIGLSGTPITKSPDDLFSALNWLFPEAYPSKVKFIDRFCITADSPWGQKIVLGIRPEMEQEFFSGIDPFSRRMTNKVILPFLPPVIREQRDVIMGATQAKIYKDFKKDMLAELENGDIIFTTDPLVKLTRLLQLANASATIDYKDVYNPKTQKVENKLIVTLADPSAKLDAFMDDLSDFGDESVAVFAVSKQLINLLSKRLDKAGIKHGLITGDQDAAERQIHMDDFQAGKTKFILCTTSAGGTGITLTAASTMVFLQRPWSMIHNEQAEGRSLRIGSEKFDRIKIIDYVTKDTAESSVFEANAKKYKNLEYILRDTEKIRKFIEGNLQIPTEESGNDTNS